MQAHETVDAGSALSALLLAGCAIRRMSWVDGVLLGPGTESPLAWWSPLGGRLTEVPCSGVGALDLLGTDWIIFAPTR